MNKKYLFLTNLSMFLKMGYTFDESIHLCSDLISKKQYQKFNTYLNKGYSIEQLLLDMNISKDFNHYFTFFFLKNSISEAIEKSLNLTLLKENYRKKLTKKLSYPCILILFLFLFSFFIIFFLLPKVNELFISFHIEKTLITAIINLLFYIIPLLIFSVISLLIINILIFLYALKHHRNNIMLYYFNLPYLSSLLKTYFSLKFAIYYNEFINEGLDNKEIIDFLYNHLKEYDMKFILYEILKEMEHGSHLYSCIVHNNYLEQFFKTSLKLRTENHQDILDIYIKMTLEKIELFIERFIKICIPSIYIFVAFFVISVYATIIIPLMNMISEI